MIKHIVAIKFKEETSAAQIDQLKKKLASLPAQISEIKEFIFGADILRTPRSHDFGLVSLFDDTAALMRYQQHPAHIPVLDLVRTLGSSVIVVDFEV